MQKAKAFNLIPKKVNNFEYVQGANRCASLCKNGQVDIYVIYIFIEK